MHSIIEIAKKASVSKSTVSRVINNNGYVSKEVRERVLKTIGEMNYSPNHMARALKLNRSNIIALFVPTLSHPFFSKIADAIEEELYKKNMRLIIVRSQGNKEKELKLLDMINQNQVDGIIFITHHVYDAIDQTLPIVTIDRHLGNNIPCITTNNYEATANAIEYLFHTGAKKIGFIGGKPKVKSEVEKRLQAYLDVMEKHGQAPIYLYEDFNHGEEIIYAQRFLDQYPDVDAIFASGDIMANSIYQLAIARGKIIPSQLKIITYDGMMDDLVLHPIFTKCQQDIMAIGQAAVEQLLHKIKGEVCEKMVTIPIKFIKGETA